MTVDQLIEQLMQLQMQGFGAAFVSVPYTIDLVTEVHPEANDRVVLL